MEAKAISKNLDDKQFIAQTVNYANNDGVVWCVLTNGLRYCVYKTNEPVAMEQKLLFEVDLADVAAGSAADATNSLQLLSRASLINGDLDLWGERVFTERGCARRSPNSPPTRPATSLTRSSWR